MKDLLDRLSGGDRRSTGCSDEIVAEVLENPPLFDALFTGTRSGDPVVRMRSADAAEKVTARRPELLRPHKADLLWLLRECDQQEVRCHAAQMIPRVEVEAEERAEVSAVLEDYLCDGSRIVRVCAMQALAGGDAELRRRAVGLIRGQTSSDSPAVRSPARASVARPRIRVAGAG